MFINEINLSHEIPLPPAPLQVNILIVQTHLNASPNLGGKVSEEYGGHVCFTCQSLNTIEMCTLLLL